jgi:hypothetical protein
METTADKVGLASHLGNGRRHPYSHDSEIAQAEEKAQGRAEGSTKH